MLLRGRPLDNWLAQTYPSITCDVAHFAEVTGGQEALSFAHSFACGPYLARGSRLLRR